VKPPTPRQSRNGWLFALARAGRAIDCLEARGMAADLLDGEGRAEVAAFLGALLGRLEALKVTLAEIEADRQAVLAARRELRAEAEAREAAKRHG